MCELKKCSKCNLKKDIKYFEFRTDTNKYRNYCKQCNKNYKTDRKDKQENILKLLLNNLKTCGKCELIKPLDQFNNDKQTITGKTSYCKECIKTKYSIEETRNNSYKTKYKITLVDYNKIYNLQNGKCKICDLNFDKLVVDHCHDSNEVRGLLCNSCNSGLGFFKDNVYNMKNAIKYLIDTNSCK